MQATAMSLPMRPLGQPEDLDLAFASADRPALVTELLARCAGGDAAHWWTRSVGERTAALLQLFRLNEGVDRLELNTRCQNPGCGEAYAFDLPLAQIAGLAPRETAITVRLDDGRQARLRHPTGQDLQRWRAARPATREQAVRLMLDDLVLDGAALPEDEADLAQAVADSDPLVGFSVHAPCPACGTAQDVAVDLEGLVLARLAARQQALLHEVHQLASHYGWTEAQVLAVPPARRAAYRALIEREAR